MAPCGNLRRLRNSALRCRIRARRLSRESHTFLSQAETMENRKVGKDLQHWTVKVWHGPVPSKTHWQNRLLL